LSTLTKTLIILVTLSSILLCGIVVTYVANADNYRQKYEAIKTDKDGLAKKVANLTEQVNKNLEQKKRAESRLNSEASSLRVEVGELKTKLANSEREKGALLQKVNGWASVVENFTQTNDKQGQLLTDTLEKLNNLQTNQVKQRKELSETTQALVEKMAIIETIEAEKRRLEEEKAELQGGLVGGTRSASVPTPVTKPRQDARPVSSVVSEMALNGLIKVVDLKNSMVSISIGSVDGVKEGMKFHATRGNEFICDILIIDVEPEAAVGVLELVQKQPRVGDSVTTNL